MIYSEYCSVLMAKFGVKGEKKTSNECRFPAISNPQSRRVDCHHHQHEEEQACASNVDENSECQTAATRC